MSFARKSLVAILEDYEAKDETPAQRSARRDLAVQELRAAALAEGATPKLAEEVASSLLMAYRAADQQGRILSVIFRPGCTNG